MRTVVSVTPNSAGTKVKVALSDGSFFHAKKNTEALATLTEGCEIDDEALAFWRAHGGVTASEAAGRLLGMRSYSERELFDKLADRGYTPSESVEAISRLKEFGLVDDRQFAKDLVEMCIRKQRSRRAISEVLRQHGIDRELISEMLETIPDQREMVRDILRRRYGEVSELSPEEKQRAIGYLRNRGFEWRDISSSIKDSGEY
ncbi:MAG: regulatory protein RecX [Clostridia bacterium]|nr:regulatory protein RecX [Clostridia bacterium]